MEFEDTLKHNLLCFILLFLTTNVTVGIAKKKRGYSCTYFPRNEILLSISKKTCTQLL